MANLLMSQLIVKPFVPHVRGKILNKLNLILNRFALDTIHFWFVELELLMRRLHGLAMTVEVQE